MGAQAFGKHIKVDSQCNRCGLCARRCPVSNIQVAEKPIFGQACVLCLNCIYSCPQKALHPGIMKFVVIKNGFNFQQILRLPKNDNPINIQQEAKGLAWAGVKRYLLETSDLLEPGNPAPGLKPDPSD